MPKRSLFPPPLKWHEALRLDVCQLCRKRSGEVARFEGAPLPYDTLDALIVKGENPFVMALGLTAHWRCWRLYWDHVSCDDE